MYFATCIDRTSATNAVADAGSKYGTTRDWSLTLTMFLFFFQAEDGIRDLTVTGVQTCALPISGLLALRFALDRGAAARARGRVRGRSGGRAPLHAGRRRGGGQSRDRGRCRSAREIGRASCRGRG